MVHTNLVPRDGAGGAMMASRRIALNILASVQIEADIRRVLYALATPEYMEAWLQLPEVDRVECHSVHRSFDRFRIDLHSSDERQQSIYGSCQLAKPNRVTYLWERDYAGVRARSMVQIRLLGGPSICTLKLQHSGLSNPEEIELYSATWRSSLMKLCTLIEGTRTRPDWARSACTIA
jgi:uncharacterized protein YndB with AHSA1/START domain